MSGPIVVVLAAAFVVMIVLSVVARRRLYVSAPNEALIFSGRVRKVGKREPGYRAVRGGRGLRVPLFELVDSVDLTNIAIDIEVKAAYSKGGIPLNVHGVANVKLPGEEPLLNNAIERFLGRTRPEIMRVAKETLEGNHRMGLVLDTLKIQNITDDVGYLNSIGRIQGAHVRMEAAVAEARAVADAQSQQSLNWCASQIAKVDADLAIAQQETQKRIVDAQTRREAIIAESEGQVKAQVAQVTADIEKQKARLLQVKRQLEADVVRPAEADRQAREEKARGAAALVIERGRAEAQALQSVFKAFAEAGPGARAVLALQQVLPLLAEVSGAGRRLMVNKVSVLQGNGGETGSAIAMAAITASEQIKAATGVDPAAAVRRLEPKP